MPWPLVLAVELIVLYGAGRAVQGHVAAVAVRGRRGQRIAIWVLLAPGTALHETAHASAALLLGGRIHKYVPFYPQQSPDGSLLLGYVESALPVGWGPVGRAWVGMAPLWGVPLFTWVLGPLMLKHVGWHASPTGELHATFADPSALSAAWLYLWLSSSLGLLPSPSDHRDLPYALGVLTAVVVLLIAVEGPAALLSIASLAAPMGGLVAFLAAPSVAIGLAFAALWVHEVRSRR